MKLRRLLSFGFLLTLLMPTVVMAQAFGEYGRTLGGVSQQRGGIGVNAPVALPQGGDGGSGGVGDISGPGVPSRLIVASREAVLFPRQDAEAKRITTLAQGEILVPLLQAVGGDDWYMVKTQQGLIGWVKSSDVRAQSVKKP